MKTLEECIVDDIWSDLVALTENAFVLFNEETRIEIRETWKAIVKKHLMSAGPYRKTPAVHDVPAPGAPRDDLIAGARLSLVKDLEALTCVVAPWLIARMTERPENDYEGLLADARLAFALLPTSARPARLLSLCEERLRARAITSQPAAAEAHTDTEDQTQAVAFVELYLRRSDELRSCDFCNRGDLNPHAHTVNCPLFESAQVRAARR